MLKWPVAIILLSSIAAAQTPAPPTRSPSGWHAETRGSMADGSFGAVVHVSALNGIDGSPSQDPPALVVRCQAGDFAVYVITGTPAQPGYGVRPHERTIHLTFDDQPRESEQWLESENDEVLFSLDAVPMADRLLVSRRLRFEFTPLNGRTAALDFPVAGLLAASEPLRAACPSKWHQVLAGLDSLAQPRAGRADPGQVYFEFQVDQPAQGLPART